MLLAATAQERYRRRQRSEAWRFEVFRRAELSRSERHGPWANQLRAYVVSRASSCQAGSTVIGRAWLLAGILPEPIGRREAMMMLKAVGTSWLFRQPDNLIRSGAEETAAAARAAECPRQRLACWLIARAGLRLHDAIRVAGGHAQLSWQGDVLVAYPDVEKTDHAGMNPVAEPIVIPFERRDLAGAQDSVAVISEANPLSTKEAANLHRAVRAALRTWGVSDVRGARRAVGQSIAAKCGRDKAGAVLRHKPGSTQTVRYTTTQDAVARLKKILAS
jgi:hypothetical protein